MLHVPVPEVAEPVPAPEPAPRLRFNYAPGYELPHRLALRSYASWLYYERRLVCAELYPDQKNPAAVIEAGNAGWDWHSGGDACRGWRDMPPPSSRALGVLALAGVNWQDDPEFRGEEGYGPPLPWKDTGWRPPLSLSPDHKLIALVERLEDVDAAIEGAEGDHLETENGQRLENERGTLIEGLMIGRSKSIDGLLAKARAIGTAPIMDDADACADLGISLAEDVLRLLQSVGTPAPAAN